MESGGSCRRNTGNGTYDSERKGRGEGELREMKGKGQEEEARVGGNDG